METQEIILLALPLIVIQFILIIIATIDWYKQGTTWRKKHWWWLLIIFFLNLIGPIIYFIFGRRSDR